MSTATAPRTRRRSRGRSRHCAPTATRSACSGAIQRPERTAPSSRLPPQSAMRTATPPGQVGSAPVIEHRPRGSASGRVLVLNATYEPINVCSVRRAAVLLLKAKAELLEHTSWELRSEHTAMPRPAVIRLVSFVKVPRDTHRRKITRCAVFARDGWACQYCGARSNLTVDHVVPRSKGGVSTWDNIVASCAPCNRRKGDALLRQVGMSLRRKPRRPHAHVFIHVASPSIPAAWRAYLQDAA